MEYTAHGRYTVEKKGRVYLFRFYGVWNLEGAKRFFQEYQSMVPGDRWPRFGVLGDMRQLEGATPDAIESFEAIADWTTKHGQVARAVLAGSAYGEFIAHRIDKNGRAFPVELFTSEPEAMAWLQTFGLPTS